VIATEYRVVISGGVLTRIATRAAADGRWRIAHTGYVRATNEATMSLRPAEASG